MARLVRWSGPQGFGPSALNRVTGSRRLVTEAGCPVRTVESSRNVTPRRQEAPQTHTLRSLRPILAGQAAFCESSSPAPASLCPAVCTSIVGAPGRLRVMGLPASLTWHLRLVILMTMTILPLAEVKSHLSELVGRVNSQHERITVTVHGRPSAVLIATEDLESLEETIAILSDPEALARLASSDAELARGEGESEEQLAEAMTKRRQRSA